MLNVPAVTAKGEAEITPIVKIDAANIICEAVKPAECGEGTVVRLYECEGAKTDAKVALKGAEKATLTNLLEDALGDLPVENGEVKLIFRPFEIKTIKF